MTDDDDGMTIRFYNICEHFYRKMRALRGLVTERFDLLKSEITPLTIFRGLKQRIIKQQFSTTYSLLKTSITWLTWPRSHPRSSFENNLDSSSMDIEGLQNGSNEELTTSDEANQELLLVVLPNPEEYVQRFLFIVDALLQDEQHLSASQRHLVCQVLHRQNEENPSSLAEAPAFE
jgi:hypothetical protein